MARYSYNAPPTGIPHKENMRKLVAEKDIVQRRLKEIEEEIKSMRMNCDHTFFMYHKDPEDGMLGLAKYICSKCGVRTVRNLG